MNWRFRRCWCNWRSRSHDGRCQQYE
jgi:hypothetical protein